MKDAQLDFEGLAREYPRLKRLEKELQEALGWPEEVRRRWASEIYGEIERNFADGQKRRVIVAHFQTILPKRVSDVRPCKPRGGWSRRTL